MELTNSNIIYLLAWFILPIIPAFVLFRFLPSGAIVEGPFKGLTVKLGGAFAGYFLLFIVLIPKMFNLIKEDDNNRVWTISGSILDSTGNKIKIASNPRLTLIPTTEINNGDFNIKIIGKRESNGRIEFPRIAIQADKYVSTNLDPLDHMEGAKIESLPATQWLLDCKNKTATLKAGFKLAPDRVIIPQTNNMVQDDTTSI